MKESQVAQLREFKSLDEFIQHSDGFCLYFFVGESLGGQIFRGIPCFKRFQEKYPVLERELTREVGNVKRSNLRQELPYSKLWEAYKLMSNLVYVNDPGIIINGAIDSDFLCR